MIALYAFLSFYSLWVFYLAVMNLKRVNDSIGLSLLSKVFGYPVIAVGLLIDLFCNWTVFTVICLQPPGSPLELVTGRLKRYKDDPYAYKFQKKISSVLASELLNSFDPSGRHV